MRRAASRVAWLLAGLLSQPLAAQQDLSELNEAFLSALKAGDLDALVRLHDPRAVLYPPGEPDQKGLDAIRVRWGKLLKANRVKEAYFLEPKHVSSGDLSAGWGHIRLALQPKSGQKPVTIAGRFLAVARKRDGKWLYDFVSVAELEEVVTFERYSKAPPEEPR